MRPVLAIALIASSVVGSGSLLAVSQAQTAAVSPALKAAVAGKTRTPANLARDQYRNPAETLAFFGVKPTHTVVEIWPGGGWYTEILAPYLKQRGTLIVAPPARAEGIGRKLDAAPATYGKVRRAAFPSVLGGSGVAPGTADVVVTFRNIHNWMMGSAHPEKADYSEAAFREMYAMLKPGGVLGIEEHRLPESADAARSKTSGYVKVSTVRALAEKAGFQFVAASEVNANPRDTADYPKGVWTLPPNFAEGETDKARYAAIGESDRMTLKFVKPKR